VGSGGFFEGAWTRADWLSLGQLVFTFLGFVVAIWQLARAASAAEETRDNVADLKVTLLSNDLLVKLPRLHRLEDDIDNAIKSGNREQILRSIVEYSRASSEVGAMLEGRSETADEPLVKMLKEATSACTKMRNEMTKGSGKDPAELAQAVLLKVSKVSPEVSAVVARLQRKVESS
jgi:hypothetical protein